MLGKLPERIAGLACGELGRLLDLDCILFGAMAWSPWMTWPANGEAVTTVPIEGVGGGVGECERKSGWMCDSWFELARRRGGGTARLFVEPLSEDMRMGDCMGESGRGILSAGAGSSMSGKGPSRGLAGETGRLPGMGSRDFLPRVGFVTNGLMKPCSTEEVSQLSNPSPRQKISRELLSWLTTKLPESLGVLACVSISFVREVIGRIACEIECLNVEDCVLGER